MIQNDRHPLWQAIFSAIINRQCAKHRMNRLGLCARWGVSQSILSRLENDKQDSFKPEKLRLIDGGFGAPEGWTQILWNLTHVDNGMISYTHRFLRALLRQAGYADVADEVLPEVHEEELEINNNRLIPVMPPEVGDPSKWRAEKGKAVDWIQCPRQVSGPNAFGLVIEDDSMDPEVRSGDTVVVDPEVGLSPKSTVVYRVGEESVTCRSLDGEHDDTLILRPANLRHDLELRKRSEVSWIYRVVALCRKL